jgi:hypothetical protein
MDCLANYKKTIKMHGTLGLLLLFFVWPLAAQEQKNSSGSTDAKTQRPRIAQGKIVDEKGNPISGAAITIENSRRMFHREVRSDKRGQWRTTGILAMAGEEFPFTISATRCLTRKGTIKFIADKIQVATEMHSDPRLEVLALFAQAAQARRNRQYGEALTLYEQILVIDMDNYNAGLGMGICRLQLGQLAPAAGITRPIQPPPPATDERLAAILKLAANYCQRMGPVAFKYFCTETVEEETWPGRPHAIKNQYQYDFQIIGKKRTIYEQRDLLEENGRRINEKKAEQKTIFQSSLMFFSPIDLLAAENQPWFTYRLLGAERVGDQDCLLLDVRAKHQNTEAPLLEGRVLLSSTDGSVMRIEVAQTTIIGIAGRRKLAMEEGYQEIEISNIHWYDKVQNGLRFPSYSEMREIYVVAGLKTLHYMVQYAYANYNFFQVDLEVINSK